MKYKIVYFILIESIFLFIVIRKKNKYLYLFLIILYSFFIGYRDINIGIDTKAYVQEYLTGNGGYFSEKGFTLLSEFLYKLGCSWQTYFTILSILSFILYFYGYNFDKNKYLYHWVYLFNVTGLYGSVNGIRQFIAGGFFLLSIKFLKKKYFLKSYFLFIIGLFFHKSLVVFLFLYNKKIIKGFEKIPNKYKNYLLISIFILSIFFKKYFLLNNQISDYSKKIGSSLFYIKYIAIVVIYLIYQQKTNKNYFFEYVFYYILIVITFFINFSHLANRFLYYINIFTPIILYRIIYTKKEYNKKIFITIIYIYHILILFYSGTKIMFLF